VNQIRVRLQPDGNLVKRSWCLQHIEVSGGDLQGPVRFVHGQVLSPDNPTAVLEARTHVDVISYHIAVVTAAGFSSATDSSVYLTLVGDGGDSGELELKDSEHMNKFESGQTDTFTFCSPVALGSVNQIRVRLQPDGNLVKRSWCLQHIEVSGGDLQGPVRFVHGQVLSPDNPTAVLDAAKHLSRGLKPALSKKTSSIMKKSIVSQNVIFGFEIQRALPSINGVPVCFTVEAETNTLIIGELLMFLCVGIVPSVHFT
jgi:hypothetical protein